MKNYLILLAILIPVLVLGCTNTGTNGTQSTGTSGVEGQYTFAFHVNETNEVLNGDVYINGEQIGMTQNGTLNIDVSKIYPGELQLTGNYNGSNFTFYFTLNRTMIDNFTRTDFWIYQNDIDALSFNLTGKDMSAVAKQIFDKINEQRKLNGYQLLVWNDKIAAGAELYAKEVSIGRYDHSPSDRFVENKIAYIMPGSVYYSLNVSKDMDIANYTVNSIFSSASLKNLVLLDDYDTAGIFVYCKEKACYSVIDMDQTKVNETFQLNKNSCTYREIYPSLLPYNQPVNMKITFNSTAVIDFYVLESKDYYVVCTPNHFVNESTYSKSFSTSLTAQKGYLLSFYARDGANITYTLEYEP